ncbi:FAD/NAD(P)-binding protein [Kineococcus terrestris]|uniref:FAD/NAD(P)-binding protein n=1 Tax=Kineococcus terrestris TaxID=2044856 RepID=UPI0034DB71B3
MTRVPAARTSPRPVPVASTSPAAPGDPLRVALVGAGPRALGVLDRLGVHAAGLERPLRVHVVDPHPPGAGRTWRPDQHPLLWMNSRAADVTVFPDETSTLTGELRPGPTLFAWLDEHRDRLAREFAAAGQEELRREVLAVREGTFVSRALGSRYLAAAWRRVADGLPATASLRVHATSAVDLVDADGAADGGQVLHLADGTALAVDAVLLAQGHPDVEPGPRERELQRLAAAHGLTHLAPAYTSDLHTAGDLDALRPGEDVLVLGMGLAFVDLLVLVGEGRGGRFTPGPDGGLVYEPSGAEPVLHVGSRRGVPYRSKITYELAERPPLPRHFTVEAARELAGRLGRPLRLRADVWPLVARELTGAHHHELSARHPERTGVLAAEFERAFAAAPWGSAEMDALLVRAAPACEDRLDLHRLDRPLDGWSGADAQAVGARVAEHVAADVARRGDPRHSADAAVFAALLSCYVTTAELARQGLLDARSAAVDVDGWWHGFFSYVASGPPPQRLQQLLALHRAGLVRFLGADADVDLDPATGTWRGRAGSGPGVVHARALVDARLPSPSVARTTDPLLRALRARGEAAEQEFRDPDGAVVTGGRLAVDAHQRLARAGGGAHPRRFAAGPWVAGGGWAAAFARPRLDAGFFRLNDALALDLLAAAGSGDPAAGGLSAAGRPRGR